MKRESVGREIKRCRHLARGKSLRPCLYEQAKDIEPVILSKCGQGRHGI